MKMPLVRWGGEMPEVAPYLVRIPYDLFGTFAAQLDEMDPEPYGLVPPVSADLNYTARCMATARDFFPDYPIYAPVFLREPRPFIRAARAAGFKRFAVPYIDPFPHFFQEVHDLLPKEDVHVAGPADGVLFEYWLEKKGLRWSWSKEALV